MGTRGLIGYVLDGETYTQYVGYDAYPSYTGVNFLDDVRAMVPELDTKWMGKFRNLKIVGDGEFVPNELIPVFKEAGYTYDLTPVREDPLTYYRALYNNSGKLLQTVDSGYFMHSPTFADDSLFCEWVYIWDLTLREVRVYSGRGPGQRWRGVYLWKTYKDTELPVAP